MSRPFQFTDKDDIANSPLDRRPQNPYPQGQPPSFKTNVNRAKTKKWVEAKSVSYGGDDWDDYDEDDEYGVSSAVDERAPPMAPLPQNRSFTTPVSGPSSHPSQLHRTNSFERGDERRAFSSTTHPAPMGPPAPRSPGPPLHVDTGVPARQVSVTDSASQYSQSAGATRQVSAASFAPSATSDNTNPENRRDFSPSAMPPPLKTPATAASPPPADATPLSPASASKAARIVRPSDIYKRMEEEREKERRASIDSNTRSIDTSRSRSQEPPNAPPPPSQQQPPHEPMPAPVPAPVPAPIQEPRMESTYRMGAPLETVAERKSEYYGNQAPVVVDHSKPPTFSGLPLPAFESSSGFDDFWDEASKAREAEQASAAQSTADASLQHQPSVGYRSMVNQAFDASTKVSKQDSTRSQAATESSGITRSDTSGTSDISPIMTRVPSSAASALTKHAEHRDTPPIAEEPEADDRGRVRQSAESAALADIKQGYRRSLNPPSGSDSPARSPVVETRNPLEPVAAELLTSPASEKAKDSSFREADLAAATSNSPTKQSAPVAALEKAAQDNFIATHDQPAEASPRISRSESPTKGRVADLTGKFNNEVTSDPRRNSQQSVGSKKSATSLKDSSSRPSSSHGANVPERPTAEREISFRPRLPGGFDSFASTTDAARSRSASPVKAGETELEPTTAKQPVEGKDFSSQGTSSVGPMAALAAAGAAIAASIQGTSASGSAGKDETTHPGRTTGEIYNRPLPPDRMESTASSVIAPTPPVKDDLNPPLILTKDLPQPPKLEHRDTAESADFESDRLRRDIVRSLSPTEEKEVAGPASSLGVPTNRAPNRHSNTILSEYESYWAGSDDEDGEPKMSASAFPSRHVEPPVLPLKPTKSQEVQQREEKALPVPVPEPEIKEPVPVSAPVAAAPVAQVAQTTTSPTSASPSAKPGFLTQRFSWEMTPADSPVKEDQSAPVKAMDPTPERSSTGASAASTKKSAELMPTDPLSLNPKLSSEHLQIRNAEPGELPSPEEARGPSLESIREEKPLTPTAVAPVSPLVPTSPTAYTPVTATTPREAPGGPRPLSSGLKTGHHNEARPPSFREILAIKATDVRIAKYDETRMQFANMNTGLENWLRTTMSANPGIQDLNTPVSSIPVVTTSSPIGTGPRHKATASLTKVFSGQGDKLTASPVDASGPSSADHKTSPAALRGKELMSKASVLGGKSVSKGMKEAKGLFAKGKSRFRTSGSEKAYPLEHSSSSSSTSSCSSSYTRSRSILRSRRPSRASSLSSVSSSSSRSSSIFSVSESRCSSIESISPLMSQDASLDTVPLMMSTTCPSCLSSPLTHDLQAIKSSKGDKPHDSYDDDDRDNDDNNAADDDDDYQPFWSDGWLRENTDFTVMAIFKRKPKAKDDTKPVFGQPDAESDPELALNTRMNAQRPLTPRQGNQPFNPMGVGAGKPGDVSAPALPSFTFEGKPGSRPGSRNGIPPGAGGVGMDGPAKGIMKHSNASSGGLVPPGVAPQQRSASSPLSLSTSGPALKMGERNSHARIVSMMAPGSDEDDDDDEDPPSPVSPVDDDDQQHRFPPNGRETLGRLGNMRAASSSTTRLPPLITQQGSGANSLAPTISMGSPMLRPNSHIGIGGALAVDSPSRPRVSFQPPEAKGKEKATGGADTPTSKHLRFDSSTFNDKGKEPKKAEEKEKPAGGKKFAPSLIIPRFGGGRGRGTPTAETPTEKIGGAETPTGPFGRGRGRGIASGTSTPRSNLAPPPSAMKRPNVPETGQLTPRGRGAGLQRADSQFDRMAAIANAHRMMREQFDQLNGPSETPADLMASESAARMASTQSGQGSKDGERLEVPHPTNGKAIAPIAEEGDASGSEARSGRSRASSFASSVRTDDRSRSREARPTYTHAHNDSRSSSMPRYAGASGARASSIPRPESIVSIGGGSGDRRQSWGSGAASPDRGIGVAVTTPMLTISKGQSPVTPVSTSSLGGLPSQQQQRRSSGQLAEPRLSAGPGPTIRSESPASQPGSGRATPSMVITSPESPPRTQASASRQSQRSVSSMGESAGPHSGAVSPAHSARPARPAVRPAERPMSYIMSERDERGYISEVISTGKNRVNGDLSEAEDDVAPPAGPAADKKTLDRLMGQSSDRSGQTSRTSIRSEDDDDDDLYKQPSPKVVPVSSNELAKDTSKDGKHRSVQLQDRPYSRDESASGASTPSQRFVTPLTEPDANPIAHLQSPPTPVVGSKKGGLLSKLKGKPGPVAAVAASGHSQNSSRDTTNTSSEEQRLSSMTSTTASVQSDVKEKKGRRGSGLFSLRRSTSTEPIMVQPSNSNAVIPPHNQVRINTNVPPVSGPKSAGSATPRRSATSVEPSKKRRGTLGGLFSRSGTSTPTQQAPPPMPSKPSAKSTIFHRVPNNPASNSWDSQQGQQGFAGPRTSQTGPPPAPSQGSRPPSSSGRPGSFVHQPGASGHAAIVAQQQGVTTSITSDAPRRERRSMSLTGSGGLFGRKRTDSSPSGRRSREQSRDRSNSMESQSGRLKKWRKGSKGSISGVDGVQQHQERPWAITLPGAEDNDPHAKEIERAEIMHAASSRWQRGSDGQYYPLGEQSPSTMSSATPISPRAQQMPPPQGHQGPPPHHHHPHPAHPQPGQAVHYQPAGLPGHQQHPGSQGRDEVQSPDFYSPQTRLPPPQAYPARPTPYRPGHNLDRDPEKPAVYEPNAGSRPAQPVIPPMPQGNVPLMQPQPRRTSWQADVNDPRMDPSYRSQGGAAQRSATTAAGAARGGQHPNVGSPRSPRSQGQGQGQGRPAEYFPRPPTGGSSGSRSNPSSREGAPPPHQPDRRPSVPMKDRPGPSPRMPSSHSQRSDASATEAGAIESQNFVAALEAERRKHGEHTGMGSSSSSKVRRDRERERERAQLGLHVNVPITNGKPPPQVGVLEDTTAAVASTGFGARRSRRGKEGAGGPGSEDEDENSAPVMKATSFPGDEWVPEFYYE